MTLLKEKNKLSWPPHTRIILHPHQRKNKKEKIPQTCAFPRHPLSKQENLCTFPVNPPKSGCNSFPCPAVIPLKAFHLLVSESGNQQLPAAAGPKGARDGPPGAPLGLPNEGH